MILSASRLPVGYNALIASPALEKTPVNRYWRVDFATLDLKIDAVRPLVNPTYELPAQLADAGILFCSLAEATTRYPELVARVLGKIIPTDESRFTALTATLAQGGYFLYAPAKLQIHAPLVIRIVVARGSRWCPQNVILIEDQAAIIVQEEITTDQEQTDAVQAASPEVSDSNSNTRSSKTLVCGTSEMLVGSGAHLTMTTYQQLDPTAEYFMTRRAQAASDANVTLALIELGANLLKSRLDVLLTGVDAKSNVTAIAFPHAKQHLDLSTDVLHGVRNTYSQTLVKAAAIEHGQGRYSGNIRIIPGAHGSEASLRDDSLLLSPNAHIDAVPALEIAANDVQAFHGATVGAIDAEIRFYLMSRGITAQQAEQMIALAFFDSALQRIADETLREQVAGQIASRVGNIYAN